MTIQILLADDHKIMREGLKSLLGAAEDIKVVAEAVDGGEAVQMALEHSPDVIVMDMNMPEMSGIEATQEIIAANPAARILVLSMIKDKSCVMECLKSGAKGYLIKNCAAEELIVAIRTLAAGESYLCSKITDLVIKDIAGQASDSASSPPRAELSKREQEVLRLIADGKSTKEIAYTFGVSIKTVDAQRKNIMNKLQLFSIAELTKHAIREGLTTI
ncbi:MAG: DNA-binding response regulator [Geobacteraceae bacterium GWB2_52_12]|nr:MAG: DNA-binding response regulator [Geobacteraceae bacterium GWB2_52_12]